MVFKAASSYAKRTNSECDTFLRWTKAASASLQSWPQSWRPESSLSSTVAQGYLPQSMRSLMLCGGRNESWKKLIGAAVGTDFQSNERRRGVVFGERSRRLLLHTFWAQASSAVPLARPAGLCCLPFHLWASSSRNLDCYYSRQS